MIEPDRTFKNAELEAFIRSLPLDKRGIATRIRSSLLNSDVRSMSDLRTFILSDQQTPLLGKKGRELIRSHLGLPVNKGDRIEWLKKRINEIESLLKKYKKELKDLS